MNALIQIIAHRSNLHWQKILQAYFNKYPKKLADQFKTQLSGNFKEAVISLFFTPIDFDCYQLYNTNKGLRTNEDTLIEIIASK